MAEHGFSIRLDPWEESPNKFGVVAIYDITIEWLVTGLTINIGTGDKYWLPRSHKPAFRLPADEAQLEFYRIGGEVVVKIPGKNQGDYLCLTYADRILEQFDLLERVEQLRSQMGRTNRIFDFGGVVLPNIVFDTGSDGLDISWLIGLITMDAAGDPWVVVQAKMQAKFAMGPKGARAKVAVAIAMTRECVMTPKPDYVADHNLIIWMERDSFPNEPFFVAYVLAAEFADHTVDLKEID